MAKKRRKLNKDFEKKIYSSKKNVELVLAKIYDIDDEDIDQDDKEIIHKDNFIERLVSIVNTTLNNYYPKLKKIMDWIDE